ncbi:hypothetical protein IVA98_31185 [Bradyrhizobium sp. 160]|uniref:hypothetical protein n=1 Tax=Bradyrhizobium sp. 160 TaxID=2782634 RepID=UPI001FFBB7CA|nr:hypothetical protein [Bradyrhizobium sp. 160]MCK1627502.1 hypothetical protein [Bradyrhizobium sp. 160]
MNVVALPDRRLLDAATSLAHLSERARALQVFGPTVDFDAPVWNLSDVKIGRPSAQQTHNLYFTRITQRETRSMEGRVPFDPAFGNLIKAIIALREFARPVGADRYRKLLQAARLLYETMENRGFDPARLRSDNFHAAARAIEGTPGYKYNLAQDLEVIAEFVNKNALSQSRIVYTNPHPPQRLDAQSNKKAQQHRASKMPSEELIDAVIAMSDIVRERGDDRDILRAAIVELLLCAPWRINETLMLRAKSDRAKTGLDPATGETYEGFGFAYDGSKEADDAVKWVAPKMVEIARRAFADIVRITEPTRDIARWMERHPGRAYLAEPFRLADPSTQLSMKDLVVALGVRSLTAAVDWLTSNKVPTEKRDGKRWCRLDEVEAAMLRLQPKIPADLPQTLSQYLMLVPQHYFRDDLSTQYGVVTFVSDFQISDFLTSHERKNPSSGKTNKRPSVFERLEINDSNGKAYRVTSHAFRHYLNTIAKDGGMSELDMARWSGRKRIEQNAAYYHGDGRQTKKRAREMLKTKAMGGRIVDAVDRLPPTDRDAFIEARINTLHITDIGACIQDWSLTPCSKYGQCGGCGDHLVIKGNPEHKARTARLLAEHESMLAQAKAEMDEGTYGASDWVAHNQKIVDGLRKTLAVHENPDLEDGKMVQV